MEPAGFPHPLATRLLAFVALGCAALPLRAQEQVIRNDGETATLLELYSSEGCSSCPPAEAWVNGLKNSPALWRTLFPVVFHVDYWDGLGWPDRFAKAALHAAATRRRGAAGPGFGLHAGVRRRRA
ncbi:MAG: DUF1223 domain-containing protein [Verrucomicrobiota bacterium]